MAEVQSACRLYLVSEAGIGAAERLAAAIAAAPIASVLFCSPATGALQDADLMPSIGIAQRAGAAAVIAEDAGLARSLHADGIHLGAGKNLSERYAAARAVLGSRAIVGACPGLSRHDAMTLAEAGADYVAFGVPPDVQDRPKAKARRDGLIAWWAEIFEAPCVAFDVETAEEAEALAGAGADFVAVTLTGSMTPADVRQRVVAIAGAISASSALA
jgi:thiamine-phosphate pyrophosphorylase